MIKARFARSGLLL